MKSEMAAEEKVKPVSLKREPERELFGWTAPARPFKRKTRDFYITLFTIALVFGLVLFFVEGWLPVILIISLVFLVYVMSTIEPENIEYKITNRGIKIGSKRTDWRQMGRFWFTKRFGADLLIIETWSFPRRLEIVVNPEAKEEVSKHVSKFLLQEKIPPSLLDKAANWVGQKLPN